MEGELISIIVPVYNVFEYLGQCLESIINQTYTNIEIILIDDGSTDESKKLCDEYKNKDDRIVVIHQKNQGLSAARNAGLEICKGKYISFIDSDDYVESNYILYLYNSLKENDVRVSTCDISFVDKNSLYIGGEQWDNVNIISGKELLNEKKDLVHSVVWNKLYSSDIWENLRFPNR